MDVIGVILAMSFVCVLHVVCDMDVIGLMSIRSVIRGMCVMRVMGAVIFRRSMVNVTNVKHHCYQGYDC